MKRFITALKFGFWAFKNPKVIQKENFKMLSDLLILIMKVATEGQHYMSNIAYVHPDEGEKHIVSIWAGAGIGAEPTKRIAELNKENMMLKSEISVLLDKIKQNS